MVNPDYSKYFSLFRYMTSLYKKKERYIHLSWFRWLFCFFIGRLKENPDICCQGCGFVHWPVNASLLFDTQCSRFHDRTFSHRGLVASGTSSRPLPQHSSPHIRIYLDPAAKKGWIWSYISGPVILVHYHQPLPADNGLIQAACFGLPSLLFHPTLSRTTLPIGLSIFGIWALVVNFDRQYWVF